MKKKLLLPFILIIFSLTCFGQSAPWKTYTFHEGHYSINFPDLPVESFEYDSSTSVTFKINLATYEISETEVLMSSSIDMSKSDADKKPIKQLLEDSRDGAASSLKASKVTTLATVLTGEPYIEFTFSTDDFVGKDRIYFINKTQYSLITIFSAKTGIPAAADKFIRSFKHLN
jgi:hypothetical protein